MGKSACCIAVYLMQFLRSGLGSRSPAAARDRTGGRLVQRDVRPHNRLRFGFLLVLIEHRVGQVREVRLLSELANAVVRKERAALRERTSVQQGEYWTANLLKHLFTPSYRGHDVQADVHVR